MPRISQILQFERRWGVRYNAFTPCASVCNHEPCLDFLRLHSPAIPEDRPECSEEEIPPPDPPVMVPSSSYFFENEREHQSFIASLNDATQRRNPINQQQGITAAAEVVNMPNSEITHFEMEIKRTPTRGSVVYLKSPFVESLMKALSQDTTAPLNVSHMLTLGWPRSVNAVYRIPNMYLANLSSGAFRQYNYPIVTGGFNPSVLCSVGLKDGLNFKITEPMSDKAYDIFAERVADTVKQLIEAFGAQSRRVVKVIGDDTLAVDTHQH